MTVNYQLTADDLMAFAGAYRRFASARPARIYWGLILPLLMVGLAVFTEFGLAVIFTLLFAASGWLLNLWIDRQFNQTVFSPDHVSVQTLPIEATLSAEGARFANDAGHTFYRWPYIRDVSRLGAYVCVTVTPIERMYIPTRAFRDDAHLNEFLSVAQSYVNGHNA